MQIFINRMDKNKALLNSTGNYLPLVFIFIFQLCFVILYHSFVHSFCLFSCWGGKWSWFIVSSFNTVLYICLRRFLSYFFNRNYWILFDWLSHRTCDMYVSLGKRLGKLLFNMGKVLKNWGILFYCSW